jgi:uncharacterized protein YciI
MKLIVLFEDNPAAGGDIRAKHMPAHLAFLTRNANMVLAAGPLKAQDGQPAGGLWLTEAQDFAAVDTLVRQDPFWPTGLRRSVRILAWHQVFADGRGLVSS